MRTMDTVKLIPASEIAMPTERAVIAALLEAAARILRRHDDGSRDRGD